MTNGSFSIDLFINERYDSLSLKFLLNVTEKASTYIFSAEAHEKKVEPIVDKEGRHEKDREEDQLFYPSDVRKQKGGGREFWEGLTKPIATLDHTKQTSEFS